MNVRWGVSEVLTVLIARIIVVFILSRLVLPYLPGISQNMLNILDRLILIGLTLFFAYKSGSVKDLGLNRQDFGKNILFGLAGGIFIFTVTTGLQQLFVAVLEADINTNPLVAMAAQAKTFSELAAPLFVSGIMAPLAEEIYYRGFALPVFIKRWGVIAGVVISGLFFSVMHLSTVWFIEIALVGMALSLMYYWTGSLLPGIIAHGFVNSARLITVYIL